MGSIFWVFQLISHKSVPLVVLLMARADVFADLFGGLMLSGIRLVLLLHNVHRFVCLW